MTASLAVAAWPTDRLAGVDMTDTLNATWEAIRHQEPDVPRAQVSIVHGKGSPHWRSDQRAVHVAERTVDAGALEILQFLLHQAAHDLVPVATVGSEGKFHGNDYKAAAERLRLHAEYVQGNGWSKTSLTAEVQTIYAPQIRQLDAARQAWEVPARQTSYRITVQCHCPRKLQVVRSVFARGPIRCEVCGHEFEPVSERAESVAAGN